MRQIRDANFDPNVWFGNVAYRLVVEENERRTAARESLKAKRGKNS